MHVCVCVCVCVYVCVSFKCQLVDTNLCLMLVPGALEAKHKWYGLDRSARAIVFGRESPHDVRFKAAVLERQDQHPATFSEYLLF